METEVFFDRLLLIGTIHVSPASKRRVREILRKEKPDIVAVELDPERYKALMERPKERHTLRELLSSARHGGFSTNFMVWLLSLLEQGLGEQFGVFPGEEMLVAIQTAKEINSKIFFVDQPLSITLRRIQTVGHEKRRLCIELIKGIFSARKDSYQSLLDLEKDVEPSNSLQELLRSFHQQFPGIFKILIHERDAYIANQMMSLLKTFPAKSICVVLGLGHLNGVKKRINNYFSRRHNTSQ